MAEKIHVLLNKEPGIINMRDRYGSTPLMRGKCSVSDPGCLSRMPDPDFYPSRIQKQQQKRGVKKISCHIFFCSHKIHKIENYLIFERVKKKIWPNLQRIIESFSQKSVIKLSKIGYGFGIREPKSESRDPRSGMDPEKTCSGSRIQGQKGTGSQIWFRNTGYRVSQKIKKFVCASFSHSLMSLE